MRNDNAKTANRNKNREHKKAASNGTRKGFSPERQSREKISRQKLTSQVQADCVQFAFLGQSIKAEGLYGYEIHTGETKFLGELQHPFKITERANQAVTIAEGLTSQNGAQGQVVGTYIHGIFDHDDFRRQVLNALRSRKGLEDLAIQRSVRQEKERAYNRLASVVRDSLDMEKLAQIMGETSC